MGEFFLYKVYGEVVKSEFELDELIVAEGDLEPTIRVICEPVPDKIISFLNAETYEERKQAYTREYVAFQIPKVGYFYLHFVNNVMTISIHCFPDYDAYSRKTYTLGSGLGVALLLMGRLPIHSGAVVHNDKCILVTGESGAGKSTITTALRLSGLKFLSDDVSAVGYSNDWEPFIYPSYPQQKLCRNAALEAGYNLEELIYIDENRDKFAIRLPNEFEYSPKKLGVIVELALGDENQEEDIVVDEIKGPSKIVCLMANTYRGQVLNLIGVSPERKLEYLKIASKVPIYRISRKPGADTKDRIVTIIRNLVED